MATFQYQARTKTGELRSGVMETSSHEAAVDLLHQQNLIVVSVKEVVGGSFLGKQFGSRVSNKDVVMLSRQLSTLFEAQIPIVEALKTLAAEADRPALRGALGIILDDVSGGLSLSQALSKHPNIFSSFYISLVKSGEESGKLQEVFTYLADYLERSYYLFTKARNAMIYPAFILAAFVGVIIVMLVVVIPRLTAIFEETGQEVPLYTQIVIIISDFLRNWGILLIFAIAGGSTALWRWSRTETGREYFHRLQLHIPIIGVLYRKLYMARFADNLHTLIAGGIPILRSLSISGDVVGNVVYKKAIYDAMESVKGGNSISSAFERSAEIPPLVTQMIRIGEASGRLDYILGSIARFYQREVDSAFENLVALIEPALIIFLGLGVGVLVASVLVPLYNLVGSF